MSVQTSPTAVPGRSGDGWVLFIGVLFMLVGVLNAIYGLAAIDGSRFFLDDSEFVFSDLRTWGWITLALGVIQVTAALSISRGGAFGRVYGIGAAAINAVGALLAMPAYPYWSLAIFALDVLVIYGLAVYGGRRAEA